MFNLFGRNPVINNDIIIVCFIVSFGVVMVIYVPIILYNTVIYYKNRNNVVYRKRLSLIVLIQCILMIFKLIFNSFLNIIEIYFDEESIMFQLFAFLSEFIFIIFWWIMILRFWILQYNINIYKYWLDDEWKSVINPYYQTTPIMSIDSLNDNNNNNNNINFNDDATSTITEKIEKTFYFKYQLKYGNINYILKHWLFYIIVLMDAILCRGVGLILTVLNEFEYDFDYRNIALINLVSGVVSFSFPFFTQIMIYKLIPLLSFIDNFWIRFELKLIFLFLIIGGIFYFMFFILISFKKFKDNDNDTILLVFHLILNNSLCFCNFILIIISTYVINKKYINKIIQTKTYKIIKPTKYKISLQTTSHNIKKTKMSRDFIDSFVQIDYDIINETKNINMESNNNITHNTLYNILSTTQGYQSFMHHLLLELSPECLLSVTEFIQYCNYITDYNTNAPFLIKPVSYKDNKLKKQSKWNTKLHFSSKIPLSNIVYNNDAIINNKYDEKNRYLFLYRSKCIAKNLFLKYIKKGSVLQINLPNSIYIDISNKMESILYSQAIRFFELEYIFEDIISYQMSLMFDSFSRFTNTKVYHKILQRNANKAQSIVINSS